MLQTVRLDTGLVVQKGVLNFAAYLKLQSKSELMELDVDSLVTEHKAPKMHPDSYRAHYGQPIREFLFHSE
jgi:hypothetical protein